MLESNIYNVENVLWTVKAKLQKPSRLTRNLMFSLQMFQESRPGEGREVLAELSAESAPMFTSIGPSANCLLLLLHLSSSYRCSMSLPSILLLLYYVGG